LISKAHQHLAAAAVQIWKAARREDMTIRGNEPIIPMVQTAAALIGVTRTPAPNHQPNMAAIVVSNQSVRTLAAASGLAAIQTDAVAMTTSTTAAETSGEEADIKIGHGERSPIVIAETVGTSRGAGGAMRVEAASSRDIARDRRARDRRGTAGDGADPQVTASQDHRVIVAMIEATAEPVGRRRK
jgi:hypothetical protein